MAEPVYRSVREFVETYGFTRQEISHFIGLGVIEPRRDHGNSVLTETDMMKIVRYNTENREKKKPDHRVMRQLR